MLFKKISTYVLIALSILAIQYCTSKDRKDIESGRHIEILHSSGDDFSYQKNDSTIFYAPYPFNQGVLQVEDGTNYDVVILSKHIVKGKEIGIEIFAKMTIVDFEGIESEVLIAKPTNPYNELVPIKDFYDFVIEQFYFKQMVQYWYSNRYGLNGTIVKGWEAASLDGFK